MPPANGPEHFDPYHKWLGIPPQDQPPNHYRLLAFQLFESDADVIEDAAQQRMAHVRTYQLGQHVDLSQKILNELAAAKVCLLNAKQKAKYDKKLRKQLAPSPQAASAQPSAPSAAPGPDWEDLDFLNTPAAAPTATPKGMHTVASKPKQSSQTKPVWLGLGIFGAVVVVLAIVLAATLGRGSKEVASTVPASPVKVTNQAGNKPATSEAKPAPKPPTSVEPKAEPKPEPKPQASVEPKPKMESKPDSKSQVSVELKPEPEAKPKPDEKKAPLKHFDLPSADEQKQLMHQLDEVYKPGEAKDQTAKVALARKLLEDGRKNEANRAEQFVLLRFSGEIAIDAGEPDLMLESVDAIAAAGFNIQPFQVKSRLLKRLLEQGSSGDASQPQLLTVSTVYVKFSREAAASGAFDEASSTLDAASNALVELKRQAHAAFHAARVAMARTHSPTDKATREKAVVESQEELEMIEFLQSAVTECVNDIQQAHREHDAIQAAQERLTNTPDDPDACLTVGRWYCFRQDDWDAGLKLLGKGSDAALKSLATDELASKPAKAEDKVARGDRWWDLAEKNTREASAAMRQRAAYWYKEAMPDLSPGLGKARVETRLAEAAQQPLSETEGGSARTRPTLAVAPFNEKTAKQHQVQWAKYLGVPVHMLNSIGMKLVLIPPGEFDLGSTFEEQARVSRRMKDKSAISVEGPQHRVRITKPFYLGKYEVTQEQWQAVMGYNPSYFKGSKNPVESVSWQDCKLFLKKLLEREKRMGTLCRGEYTLPTEAQWEFACRAGSTTRYFFGDDESKLVEYAWNYFKDSDRKTHPVGEKEPNAWGLYDMYGNVWERCQDWWGSNYYKDSPVDDPQGPSGGLDHVSRGGGLNNPAWVCRSAFRTGTLPGRSGSSGGFRAALVFTESPTEKPSPGATSPPQTRIEELAAKDSPARSESPPSAKQPRLSKKRPFRMAGKVSARCYIGDQQTGLSPAANTGIMVTKGQEVTVRASGKWNVGPYAEHVKGPESLRIAIGVPRGQLGQVLNGDTSVTFQAEYGGYLFLGIFDKTIEDNFGELSVEVEVQSGDNRH